MFCGIKSVTWCYPACFFSSLGSKLTTSSGLLKLWTHMLSKLMVIVQLVQSNSHHPVPQNGSVNYSLLTELHD